MAENRNTQSIRLRRDTEANLNPITLSQGEIAYATDTTEIKVGDGTSTFQNIVALNGIPADVDFNSVTKGGLELVHTDPATVISEYAGSNSTNTSGVFNAVIVSQDVYDNITHSPNTVYFVPPST